MLYWQAVKILSDIQNRRGSLKSLVFNTSVKLQNQKQLYALVCETLKYGDVIKELIEQINLRKQERLLCKHVHLPEVLMYDLLFGKGLHKQAPFKDALLRHKSRLNAALARMKVKAKVCTNRDLIKDNQKEVQLPRYVRVNTLKADLEKVTNQFKQEGYELKEAETGYKQYIEQLGNLEGKQFVQDPHVKDLLVFSSGTDLTKHPLYRSGALILQDKASCLPAYVLAPPRGSCVIDCCAAPGNKTSHLAALLQNEGKIYAFDKDLKRVGTMKKLTTVAGVMCAELIHQDFLTTDPSNATYNNVQYILVDPSCSGSGIVSRRNELTDVSNGDSREETSTRLENLSTFQVKILKHALSFPNVRKVVYSTCSIHEEENENVVQQVMDYYKDSYSVTKVMPKIQDRVHMGDDAVEPMQKKCLRLSHGSDLTNGFFVACFQRKCDTKEVNDANLNSNSSKNKINSSDTSTANVEMDVKMDAQNTKPKKKKKRKNKQKRLANLCSDQVQSESVNMESRICTSTTKELSVKSLTKKKRKKKSHKKATIMN